MAFHQINTSVKLYIYKVYRKQKQEKGGERGVRASHTHQWNLNNMSNITMRILCRIRSVYLCVCLSVCVLCMYKINVFFLSFCAYIFLLFVKNLCKKLYSFLQRVCVCVCEWEKTKRKEARQTAAARFALVIVIMIMIMMVYVKSFK